MKKVLFLLAALAYAGLGSAQSIEADTLPALPPHVYCEITAHHLPTHRNNGNCIPIIPIYTYEPLPTLTIAKELYEGGVYVNSSLPPAAAPHECLLRTSLMATHTHALIDEAVGVIAEVLRRYAL